MTQDNSMKEMRALNDNEIIDKISSLRKELFDLRFKQATRQLTETHKFKDSKKQLAQLLTLQRERLSNNKTSK